MFDRLKLAVAGLALGISCGIVAGISLCVIGGMVLCQLHPEFGALASTDVFTQLAFGFAGAGIVSGLLGPHLLRAYSGLALSAPLSLIFGICGLFAGPFMGVLVRLAGITCGFASDGAFMSYTTHDVLVGCEVGMALGAFAALRLLFWPPDWLPGSGDV